MEKTTARVRLEVVGWLPQAMGGAAERLRLDESVEPGMSLERFLRNLAQRYPQLKQAMFQSEGEYSGLMNVVLNDRLLSLPREQVTPLNDGDVVILVPAYAGG